MSTLLDICLEPITQIDGGLVCPRRACVFTHNPIQQIFYNGGQTKNFNEIGASIMTFDYNCTEQLIVFSSTWHKIVDIETGRKIREIYEQDGFVSAVSFSKTNPNVFASTGTDSSIRTWDIRAHPAQTLHLRRQRRYKSVEYSPDSNFLAFGGEAVNLVDLSNPRNISQINCPSPVLTMRFNPVEYVLTTSNEDRVVRFWDIDTQECISQSLPFESTVKNVEFDSQGKCLIASCASTISALHWEPFECAGQLDLCSMKSRNLSGANSVPSSNGSSTNRSNAPFKSLDLRTFDDKILHLGFDESTHRLLLQSTTISELCSVSPNLPAQPLDFGSNAGSFAVESPTSQQQHWDTNSNHSLGSPFDETPDSAIGNTVRSFVEVARERHQSSSESFGQKAMTGPCCISMSPMTTSKLPGSLLSNGHPARPQNLHVSHSESRIQKPTRARSNIRLNAAKEARGSNTTLSNRAPSVEATSDGHQRPATRTLSTHGNKQLRQPTTPVEDRSFANLSLKRNGSLPNNENAQSNAAEKHSAVMEMLNSRIRDCKRINSLLKTRNGEDEALDEAAKMTELHIFAQLLRGYKQNPTAYNLQICSRIIPTLRRMLVHKNASYVDLALDTLANILNEFTEPIKHALAPNAVSIGVDLAAEQRHMHCTNCKRALTELYINSSFILEKLTPPQRDYLNMLIPKIEQISEL